MKKNKKTVVLGASTNPDRYAYKAVMLLRKHEHEVIAVGLKSGKVADVEIHATQQEIIDTDTVTLYLNPTHQKEYYEYILKLKPRRLIFNPGTENPELENIATENGIHCEEACTLVLLNTGQF